MALELHLERYWSLIMCGMIGAVAYFQASGVATLVASSVAEVPPLTTVRARSSLPIRRASAAPIYERNVFDSEMGSLDESSEPVTGTPSGATATGDPLMDPLCEVGWVLVIAASDDPQWSFAAIEDKEGKTVLRRAGDTVGDHTVLYVSWDRVWLANGGGRCQMRIGQKPQGAAKAPTKPAPPSSSKPSRGSRKVPPEIAAKIHKVSDTEYEVERAAIDDVLDNHFDLLKATRVRPIKDGDKVTGMRMSRITPGTLLHTLGVRNGDVIRSINGFELTDPQKALEAYGRLRTADRLTLSLERGGKPVAIEIGIK